MLTRLEPAGNWAGNVTYRASGIRRPETVQALQALVASAASLRTVGTGHSFNDIVDTTGELISLDRLIEPAEIDTAARTVRVSSRTTYGQLSAQLLAVGLALPNLGSLPHISVAGACSTGTHGSGDTNRVLAAQVRELELVVASGDRLTLRRGDQFFDAAVIGLGALGVVTTLVLDAVAAFDMRQVVYNAMPAASFTAHFDEITASAYSVSAFTDWRAGPTQLWLKQRVGAPSAVAGEHWLGARRASRAQHPVAGEAADNTSAQLGEIGPSSQILPTFRLDFVPSSGAELQSEYFIGRPDAPAAIAALHAIGELIRPALLVSEIRTVAADRLWLSPAYDRDTVGFHFTWRPDVGAVHRVLPRIEQALAPFTPRAHWAKMFTLPPARVLDSLPRSADFASLRREMDPTGKFANRFVHTYFG